jgi:hemerythrin-like domain-containing protein
LNKNDKIIFGLLGLIGLCGLIYFFNKKSNKVESSFSGCNGLKGDEGIDNMCNHLSSEHANTEREIINILFSANKGKSCTKDVIDVWDKELKHHFQEEENVVFPNMLNKNKSLKPIIDDLLNEHNYFYSTINEMKKSGNCDNLSVEFCQKILRHIEKEEELFNNI